MKLIEKDNGLDVDETMEIMKESFDELFDNPCTSDVVEIDNNSFDIDLGNYSKGLYFLKLYSNLGSVTKKLILK